MSAFTKSEHVLDIKKRKLKMRFHVNFKAALHTVIVLPSVKIVQKSAFMMSFSFGSMKNGR